jgi:LuxR family maltose regulon positive regulatory protein
VRKVIDESLHSTVPTSKPHPSLSPREVEVWNYLATPLSTAEIARRLFISRNTMKSHLRSIYRKLGVATRAEAIAKFAPPTADR